MTDIQDYATNRYFQGIFEPQWVIRNYAYSAGGWTSFDGYPRQAGNIHGDGFADIVGFGNREVFTSLTPLEPSNVYSSIFADAVVSYEPDFGGGSASTDSNFTDPIAALGSPNYDSDTKVGSVSLGFGGRVTLEFVDNVLVGSGDAEPDLLLFEIGGPEAYFVEISVDGTNFIDVGQVTGGTSTLDIDPFLVSNGFDLSTEFRFVRLQDDSEGASSGRSVGADIDAIATLNPSIFADALVSYEPDFGGGSVPTNPNFTEPSAAIGSPNYESGRGSVSLGSGGRITLEFTDNILTGNGSADPDLMVFEIGSGTEGTLVEISVDGTHFISVGNVAGGATTLDIDPFLLPNGLDASTEFRFVRLQDNPNQGGTSGSTVGADIDAIAALSSIAVNRPILGTRDNDDLVGTVGNDEILGLRGDDDLFGRAGDDRLDGDRGDDFLFGGVGNDWLDGDRGDDRLIGVAETGVNLGANEIDTLIGGYGADEFVLGDVTQSYYSDGMSDDYAVIQDFDRSEDVIVLNGASDDYVLGTAGTGLPSGTAIFRVDSSGSDDLVAIVQGDPIVALNIESVLYV